ncbi:hypothetical protein ACIA8E_40500 [Streptomyces sp. NPDC051664]|uniref:hypothetical protein n=1 Tax=Streptomyces sp. NPDC051664 TaxID=3365668 RepID=UPI0037AAA718
MTMSDPGSISDLDKNRSLAAWLEWQLRQTRNQIRELEIQEEQERRRRERARAEQSAKTAIRYTDSARVLLEQAAEQQLR